MEKTVKGNSTSQGGVEMNKKINIGVGGQSGYIHNVDPLPLVEPTVKDILAIEKALSGKSKELFEEVTSFLERQPQDDYADQYKRENLPYIVRGFTRFLRDTGRFPGMEMAGPYPFDFRPQGVLRMRVRKHGKIVEEHDLGIVSVNVVTNAGVNYIIDAMQGSATITNLKFHASGTDSTSENASDTALGAEVATRATGTTVEGASANIYRSVGTIAYAASFSLREHGLLSASSGGTLFDRSVFALQSVDSSTSIEYTYEWTLNAGG